LIPFAFSRSARASQVAGSSPSFGRLADGVGHNENPVAAVRGATGDRRYAVPFRIIPARGQVAENDVEPPSKESCDVLHEDVPGS
jgi:hypothetical protein